MKKILLTALFIILANVIVILLLLPQTSPFDESQTPIYLAVVGPMSGNGQKNGEMMINGVRLYVDKINEDGGINGKKIELIIKDDKDDARTALDKAFKISTDDNVLLVIGHYGSAASASAGDIYKGSGIPTVTGSATAGIVTFGNDWFFRTIPDNSQIQTFVSKYIKYELKKTSVSIIFDNDVYGSSLAAKLDETSQKLGIKINGKWEFDTSKNKENLPERLDEIVDELRSMDDPGVIFLATHASYGTTLLSSFKYPGTKYTVIGPDSFSTSLFMEAFNRYSIEKRSPGYYSDGIYAVSPFMAEISGKNAIKFQQDFMEKYNEAPSWTAAAYYDVAHVALEAIKRAEVRGKDILRNRRKVRDALARINKPEIAIKGVIGDIWFKADGSAGPIPLDIGIWQKQKFIPAFTQYQMISEEEAKEKNYELIEINDQNLTEIRVVYAGIDINEISNVNMEDTSYSIDFYLWFRFQGTFDDKNIRFENALNPIDLGSPVMEETIGDVTSRAYRVKGVFKAKFDLFLYPFDTHLLPIHIHHVDKDASEKRLIYVPDVLGMPPHTRQEDIEKGMTSQLEEWNVTEISFHDHPSTDKTLVDYSQFNVGIRIERKGWNRVFAFFPIILMIVILYFVYFIPPNKLLARVFTFLAVLGGVYQIDNWVRLKMIIEYAFYTVYGLSGIAAVLSVCTYMANRRNADRVIEIITFSGKIIHVSGALASVLFIVYVYYTGS